MGNTVSPCTPLERMKIYNIAYICGNNIMRLAPCVKAMAESECEVNYISKKNKVVKLRSGFNFKINRGYEAYQNRIN